MLGVQHGTSASVGLKKVTVQTVSPSSVADQLDIRGQRLDEAMRAVTQYIDQAFLSGKGEVTIVHGLGTGALREGVIKLLKTTNFIAHYQNAGSSGATLVRFNLR